MVLEHRCCSCKAVEVQKPDFHLHMPVERTPFAGDTFRAVADSFLELVGTFLAVAGTFLVVGTFQVAGTFLAVNTFQVVGTFLVAVGM